MAKRKHQRPHVKTVKQTPVPVSSSESPVTAAEVGPAEELGDLAQEVESFLSQRTELHQKLLHEIDATEKKLAELRRAASLLVPEQGTNARGKKGQKTRKANQGKGKKPEPVVASDGRQPSEQAAETTSEDSAQS